MTTIRVRMLLSLALLLSSLSAPAWAADKFRVSRAPVPNRYFVVFNRDTLRASGLGHSEAVARLRNKEAFTLRRSFEAVLHGILVETTEDAAIRLSTNPLVDYVEEDGFTYAMGTQDNPPWGLDRIDQRDLPLTSHYYYPVAGYGTHVYVVDSGLRGDHSEFTGRVGAGYDAVGDGNGTTDCGAGHGTHVAGIAAGTTYGVAKGATIHPVQVMQCDAQGNAYGSWGDFVEGVNWAFEPSCH